MDVLIPEKNRRIIFCAAAVAIVAFQWLAFSFAITEIEPEIYFRRAVELEVSGEWRYGYVYLWHGAVLVKTPNLAQKVPEPPVDPEDEPDLELDRIMREDLEALPRRGLLELLLYLTCLGYACFAMGPVRRALQGTNPGRLRVVSSEVLVWTGLWYIIAMPLPTWGYGTPVFTNCMGPGALSWSGISLGTSPAPYSFTVTYTYLMAAVTCWLPMLLCIAGVSLLISVLIPGASEGMIIWLSGFLWFSIFGALRAVAGLIAEAKEVVDTFQESSDRNSTPIHGDANDEAGYSAPLEIAP
jgi:hypothetical protein